MHPEVIVMLMAIVGTIVVGSYLALLPLRQTAQRPPIEESMGDFSTGGLVATDAPTTEHDEPITRATIRAEDAQAWQKAWDEALRDSERAS